MSDERPHILLREPLPPKVREYPGGGGGTYPRTSYAQHASKVFKQAEELRAMFARLRPNGGDLDREYFRLELPNDLKVTGSNGQKIEGTVHGSIVGAPAGNVGHFSTTAESFALLLEELQRYAGTHDSVGKSKFAPIEEIGPIPLAEKLGPGMAEKLAEENEPIDVLLGLFPDLLSRERQAVRAAIEALLVPSGGRVADAVDGESGTYLRVQALPAAIKAIAESIVAVQSVDQTEEVVDLSSRPGPKIEASVIVRPFEQAPLVCVIDTGVLTGNRFIDPFVVDREYPLGPPHDQDHGTFVASRVLFGDTIRDQLSLCANVA